MTAIDFLVMANARKAGGRCLAGLEVLQPEPLVLGAWIRPVSQRDRGQFEVNETHLRGLGREARPLDIIQTAVGEATGHPNQPENRWSGTGPYGLLRTASLHDSDDRRALLSACESTRYVLGGPAGSIPIDAVAPRSLELRQVLIVEWCVPNDGERAGLRAHFTLGTSDYALPVTDPEWEARMRARGPGRHRTETLAPGHSEALLTLSLGEPFVAHRSRPASHYKLVAGVTPLPDD